MTPFLQEQPEEKPPQPEPVTSAQPKSSAKQQPKSASAQQTKTTAQPNKLANAAQPSKAAASVQQNKTTPQNKAEQPAKSTPQKNVASQKVSCLPLLDVNMVLIQYVQCMSASFKTVSLNPKLHSAVKLVVRPFTFRLLIDILQRLKHVHARVKIKLNQNYAAR